MNLHTPKWAPTLGVESQWTAKSSKGNCRGQNSLDWKVLYIFEKILECRCLKWVCMTHLDNQNTSYGQKKGQESNCQFDSRPLKVRNRLNIFACRWHATYQWKDLDKGYNLAWNFTSIRGLYTKLWASKVIEVPILKFSGLPLGSLGTKWHLGVSPMARHKVYYKGEGGGFPQVWAVVSLVNPCLLVVRSCIKNAPSML